MRGNGNLEIELIMIYLPLTVSIVEGNLEPTVDDTNPA